MVGGWLSSKECKVILLSMVIQKVLSTSETFTHRERLTITAKPINAMSVLRYKWEESIERRWVLWSCPQTFLCGGFFAHSSRCDRSSNAIPKVFKVSYCTTGSHIVYEVTNMNFTELKIRKMKKKTHFGSAMLSPVISRRWYL